MLPLSDVTCVAIGMDDVAVPVNTTFPVASVAGLRVKPYSAANLSKYKPVGL